ncbi:MAG: UDP-4-amino-4,6-dideoxy-N-acetyl-beta-L-altrosamine transaminase [Euryarchaeota archaeon]|nr:UDP-4-amino-4,6-dideoxy-N-acetyl-beta-L-altrosamine transaminase [Euryarchaeota archaeon]
MPHKKIPYGHQYIDDDDIQAVTAVLQSDWLTQGPLIEQFEEAVAAYCHAKYAVCVNSATSALHIACKAAGLSPGHTLWTSPNTFVASANCACYCGADPDFVDIDPETYNLSPFALERKLTQSKPPKVLIPVHFAGQSCDMQIIRHLMPERTVIIEDASHAIGGKYQGNPIGCCQYSDMTVFSFHPVKIITSAEGGMVLTNNKEYYEKLKQYRSHGIIKTSSPDPWMYEQIELGWNYRMPDILAALGLSQLQKIDMFVKERNRLARRYHVLLSSLPVICPSVSKDTYSSWHLYVIWVDPSIRRSLYDYLHEHGIGVNVHYIPVHTQPYYQQRGFQIGQYPNAETYYAGAITLPLYCGLSDAEQNYIVSTLKTGLELAQI